MKILFILSPAFNPNDGGVQRTTFKLGKYFTEIGIEVSYLSLTVNGHIEPLYGTLHHVQHPKGERNSANLAYVEQVIAGIEPDIIINQMPYLVNIRKTVFQNKVKYGYTIIACLRNSLFSFKSNARDIVLETMGRFRHLLANPLGIWFVQKRHWIKHRRDLKAILDCNDYFVLLTPPNRKELQHFVGDYQAKKVLSISNSIPGVCPSQKNKEKIILYVGRLDIAQKRADLLLAFWKETYQALPDWKFVIVGEGNYKDVIDHEIISNNLPRVETTGKKAPEAYYGKASIFIMTSAYEGFPNVLLEAQSFGVVPVAFDSYAAISWIVEDNKNAVLVSPFNTQKMAQEVINLANDQQRLELMGLNALQNAAQFTIEKVGEQWLHFFESFRK